MIKSKVEVGEARSTQKCKQARNAYGILVGRPQWKKIYLCVQMGGRAVVKVGL